MPVCWLLLCLLQKEMSRIIKQIRRGVNVENNGKGGREECEEEDPPLIQHTILFINQSCDLRWKGDRWGRKDANTPMKEKTEEDDVHSSAPLRLQSVSIKDICIQRTRRRWTHLYPLPSLKSIIVLYNKARRRISQLFFIHWKQNVVMSSGFTTHFGSNSVNHR